VPGSFFSWELGKQPEFQEEIDPDGWLLLQKGKLIGAGYAYFAAQVLMGDPTDNIPGLPGCGPVSAYAALHHCDTAGDYAHVLEQTYADDEALLEQGRLCWMTRRLHPDGTPVLWELGMTE